MAVNNDFPAVPKNYSDKPSFLRSVMGVVNSILSGKTNNCGEFTLATGAATTVINDPLCNANSVILLTPVTAVAVGETGAIVAAAGSFTVNHVNSAVAGRTFRYVVVG